MSMAVRILFGGDIMPGGVLPYQDEYIASDVKAYLKGFDYRIGTLECAIGTDISPAPEKLKENGGNDNVCFARNEDFFRVKEMGFNAVSLGNNHSFDLGKEGLKNTIQHLRDNCIGYFGAGMNISEASAPYITKIGGYKFAFIGCCIKGIAPKSLIVATEDSYGVYQPTIEELTKQISLLKKKYDYIIIMPHWGEEHVRFPSVLCIDYSKRMVDAGADAVLSSHSHCLSTNIAYKGKPIYFGMGNFLYPDICLLPPRPFFYPTDRKELSEMRKCVNYPWSVSTNTLCVWGEDSRLGLAVETCFSSQITTNFKIVRMGCDNILRWYSSYSRMSFYFVKNFLLPLMSYFVKSACYRFIYKIAFRYERGIRNLGDFRKHL